MRGHLAKFSFLIAFADFVKYKRQLIIKNEAIEGNFELIRRLLRVFPFPIVAKFQFQLKGVINTDITSC